MSKGGSHKVSYNAEYVERGCRKGRVRRTSRKRERGGSNYGKGRVAI